MANNNVQLSPPWCKFYHEVEALFGKDPDIQVIFDEEDYTVTLYVEDEDKAYALDQILPAKKVMGNIVVTINVIPANDTVDTSKKKALYEKAFAGNPVFSRIEQVSLPMWGNYNYCIFNAGESLVQFYNDELQSPWGLCTMVLEDAARDVLAGPDGMLFTTDQITPPNEDLCDVCEAADTEE